MSLNRYEGINNWIKFYINNLTNNQTINLTKYSTNTYSTNI